MTPNYTQGLNLGTGVFWEILVDYLLGFFASFLKA